MEIYRTTITSIGPIAKEMLEAKMLIIFNNNAPAELGEMCYLHTIDELKSDIKVGDQVHLGDTFYTVTAVGSVANQTMRTMGHCTLCFNGAEVTQIPGQIELEAKGIEPNLSVGDEIRITRGE
ncbi:MAG: PTS glucitol/sorbitol transporter subunit IIA [Eubacteriaceae bacterium]|jgi:PTS system glucitol/sorbitol-specific IIA component|nr:PTS glucitol/sorbitol transporter subunit IIA [Eubacteriaceae bacterium]